MNDTIEREPIGLKDVNGNDIHLGDLVEFYVCLVHGASSEKTSCGTRMVDVVTRLDEKTPIPGHVTRTYYFVNWMCDGAFATKFNKFCRVIGTMPKDVRLLADQIPDILIAPGKTKADIAAELLKTQQLVRTE